jgi:hypothetical protein
MINEQCETFYYPVSKALPLPVFWSFELEIPDPARDKILRLLGVNEASASPLNLTEDNEGNKELHGLSGLDGE